MVKVLVNKDLFVVATGTSFTKGETVEVSDKMYQKHGPKGTGIFGKAPEVKTKAK